MYSAATVLFYCLLTLKRTAKRYGGVCSVLREQLRLCLNARVLNKKPAQAEAVRTERFLTRHERFQKDVPACSIMRLKLRAS